MVLTSIVVNHVMAGEKILYSKVKTIQPEKTDGQYCFVKVVIKQEGDTISKEEILECADGKKGIDTPRLLGFICSILLQRCFSSRILPIL